jgi:hypothetical protein
MEDTGAFDRLAAGLPMEDRRNLLDKLNARSGNSDQPLYDESNSPDAGGDSMDSKKKYEALPWYTRLFFWFLGLFRGRTPQQMFLARQIARLGQLIEEQFPGIYDYEHDLLLPAFYQAVTGLKEAARFFYDALDMSVNRDKGAFYVFLASLEMEDIHRRLLDETDPQKIAVQYPDLADSALRQMGLQAMDEGIASIGDERRVVMYYNARTLYCLKELSSFLFDRLLVSFSTRAGQPGPVCSAHLVNNYLRNLNNILYSLKDTPPMTLLESLFIFILQDKAGAPGFNMEDEMTLLLAQAQTALEVIRRFNKRTPLNRILRCAEKDMSILPRMVSGGEDWFSLYKEYWKHTVEERFNGYTRNRRLQELFAEFRDFFNGAEPPAKAIPAGAKPDSSPAGNSPEDVPLKSAFCAGNFVTNSVFDLVVISLSFLRTFHAAVFLPELNPVLRPILLDGKFLKKENAAEFADAYNELFRIDETIGRFERDISNEGELGKRYAAAQMDMSSLSVKRHKVQLAEDEAADEAAKILGRIGDAVNRMAAILGKYDALTGTVKTLTRTLELMDKVKTLEAGR